ncbi:HNH endonuclease [Cohnella lubricantis]
MKRCVQCGALKPLSEFASRSGRRGGARRRRGTCRGCRLAASKAAAPASAAPTAKQAAAAQAAAPCAPQASAAPAEPAQQKAAGATALYAAQSPGAAAETAASTAAPPKKRRRRGKRKKAGAPASVAAAEPIVPAEVKPKSHKTAPGDASMLRPTRAGFIRMRGKTDNGRRWYQEVDPELAMTLVREHAAVVINRHTIRRIYSNKEFRRMILTRDNYICHFCGKYGDTIDHLLPRAKGGHTTPVNCVCACNECNQSKADRDLEEFIGSAE